MTESGAYDMDKPEGEGMELVMPFVVCESKGGPYHDESFTAGFQAGQIYATLGLADELHISSLHWPIFRTALTKQVDLMAMKAGFGHVSVEASDEYPEWGSLTITREVSR